MNVIDFQVGGEPVAQPRPRGRLVTPRHGKPFIQIYNPSDADEWKNAIAIMARIVFAKWAPIDGGVRFCADFRMPRPESHYRNVRAGRFLRDDAPRFHTIKPDLDNMEKAVQDALTGIVWTDDCRVCQKYSRKLYAREHEPMGVRIVIAKPEPDFMPEPALFEGVANG